MKLGLQLGFDSIVQFHDGWFKLYFKAQGIPVLVAVEKCFQRGPVEKLALALDRPSLISSFAK
jgi:hypothetical protein